VSDLEGEVTAIIDGLKGKIGVAVAELPDGPEIMIDAEEPYRAASVIKVPILYELYRKHENGNLNLAATHDVSESNLCLGSGVIRSLHRSLNLTLKDLATLMIIVSDNSATNELIDLVSMKDVNSTMQSIGLRHTTLKRKMLGLAGGDVPYDQDNLMSPSDSILLLKEIYSAKHLTKNSCDSMLDIMKEQQFTENIPRYLPEDVVFAAKSGTVKGVSNDVAVIYLRKAIGISVMCNDLKHYAYGSDAIAKIGRAVYRYYS
jgi:beta-lactamase class A